MDGLREPVTSRPSRRRPSGWSAARTP